MPAYKSNTLDKMFQGGEMPLKNPSEFCRHPVQASTARKYSGEDRLMVLLVLLQYSNYQLTFSSHFGLIFLRVQIERTKVPRWFPHPTRTRHFGFHCGAMGRGLFSGHLGFFLYILV